MSFSTFLVLHLSSPIAGAIAPAGEAESSASRFLVLARVWYQGEWSEGVIIWGSLGVHILSGVLGRVVKGLERAERRKRRRASVRGLVERSVLSHDHEDKLPDYGAAHVVPEEGGKISAVDGEGDELFVEEPVAEDLDEPAKLSRRPSSTTVGPATPTTSFLGSFTLTHITGYLLIPITIGHASLHRLIPSSSKLGLSPDLMSYAFTSYTLQHSNLAIRLKNAIPYTLLIGLGTYHALTGIRRLADPMAPPGLRPKRLRNEDSKVERVTRQAWKGGFVGAVAVVGIGVARIAREGKVAEWLGKRYDVLL
ncbi:hypothetical protein T439DRAFT_332519 [Meredithblackwellia eburnea MCA 4105]